MQRLVREMQRQFKGPVEIVIYSLAGKKFFRIEKLFLQVMNDIKYSNKVKKK